GSCGDKAATTACTGAPADLPLRCLSGFPCRSPKGAAQTDLLLSFRGCDFEHEKSTPAGQRPSGSRSPEHVVPENEQLPVSPSRLHDVQYSEGNPLPLELPALVLFVVAPSYPPRQQIRCLKRASSPDAPMAISPLLM